MDKDSIILGLLVVIIVLHLVPRPYIRALRASSARFVFWQWKRMSHLSALIYRSLHERVNGNNGD